MLETLEGESKSELFLLKEKVGVKSGQTTIVST